MRRSDREITSLPSLLDILDTCKVCRIAMQDSDGLYIVPVNFGYTLADEKPVLYIHSAKEGRKINAIAANPSVCVEMDCDHRLIEAERACGFGYAFRSFLGNGAAQLIDDPAEKAFGLSLLMKHQTGKDYKITENMAKSVAVIKITLSDYTGKSRT